MSNNRYRLSPDEQKILFEYRGIKESSKAAGVDVKDVKHGWLKTKKASLFFQNPQYKAKNIQELEQLQKEIVKELKGYAPKYPVLKRNK